MEDEKRPPHRPPIDFDWEQFDKLCSLPEVITQDEIADLMRCSKDTCANRIKENFGITFSAYRKQKQSKFRTSILAKQIQVALSGNVSMLIWLGKNYLNQTDKAELKHSSEEKKPFIMNVIDTTNVKDVTENKDDENDSERDG